MGEAGLQAPAPPVGDDDPGSHPHDDLSGRFKALAPKLMIIGGRPFPFSCHRFLIPCPELARLLLCHHEGSTSARNVARRVARGGRN